MIKNHFGPEEPCDHLFFAMVGNVGSGVSTCARIMKTRLEQVYGYQCDIVRVSDFIKDSPVGAKQGIAELSADKKVDAFQTCGNELRAKFGDDFLARRCIDTAKEAHSKLRRRAIIFDSLKHPTEIKTLKRCFEERLLTFTIFCPESIRKLRLLNLGIDAKTVDKIFERDEFELDEHGQKVRDTAYLSDFFIRNSSDNTVKIESTISRYLEIIFGTKVHTPNFEESGMAKAFGAASNSACLSRQVGAAVYDQDGKLLATGCNDVPKAQGGLYGASDAAASDHRCFNWKNKRCHNDHEKSEIYSEIFDELYSKVLNEDRRDRIKGEFIKKIKSTRVKDLIEFSRSVHAEMDALVSVARHGTGSTKQGTLFSKTFPCHNCARHIVAAGIKKVIFVEPYPKSLALKLHSDSITVDEHGKGNFVLFVQYEGVGPQVFHRFFSIETSRKKDGLVNEIDPMKARPNALPISDAYIYEAELLSLPNPQEELAL